MDYFNFCRVEPHQVNDEFVEIHQALVKKQEGSETSQPKQCMKRFLPYTRRSFLLPFAIVTATLFVGCFSGKTPLQTYAVEVYNKIFLINNECQFNAINSTDFSNSRHSHR